MNRAFQAQLKVFEKDLKTKLSQKCPATQEEGAFLTKTFKFFDIQNKGSVTQDQFARAIQKVGVVLPDSMDIGMIFSYYDRSGDGRIDYKEFSNILATGNSVPEQTPA
mmetsp:Transcript_29497/g.39253  ORF Transcript_29497/g.39253 Transcript_29497/m.39253 type:complete len:108 (-) Transcript_29497:2739-3062(-)